MTQLVRDLTQATAVRPLGGGRFELDIPDGWQQGRGAFGGMVLGAMTRAMEDSLANPSWPLRSLMGQLPAPVMVGKALLVVEELRRGSGTATLTARLSQESGVVAAATAVFGKQRVADREWVSLPKPSPAPFEGMQVIPVGPPFAPDFARFFEFRAEKHLPFSGGPDAVAEGWIRPAEASGGWDTAALVALVDAWWPAPFVREEAPRPISTIAFTFQLCAKVSSLIAGEPLFHRAHAVAGHDGFYVELRELWDARGKLVALNQQTFVFIR
jgi:acyl-CoA thioesterase